jgi:hypothetical protein
MGRDPRASEGVQLAGRSSGELEYNEHYILLG